VGLRHTEKSDYVTTEQREVDAAVVSKYEVQNAPVGAGDVVIVNMNTIHRSGENRSDRIRFSALCRYHRMTAKDYVPFRIYHTFNEHQIEQVMASDGGDAAYRKLFELG